MVTRYAATQHAAVVDHSAEVDHSAAAGRSAEADRSAVVVLDAAADHFVALVGIRVVLNGAQSVARSVVLNGARSVALNAVRKFSWGDFRSVALAVARVVVPVVAQVVILETTRVVRCAAHSVAHSVARGCYAAAGSLSPAVRAGVFQLLPASPAAHIYPADPAVLEARLT